MTGYEIRIGLEIHVELATNTKIFAAVPWVQRRPFPVLPRLLGPGSLPVLNRARWSLPFGRLWPSNCTINLYSEFVRKNYFYPDLPKAFQITQDDKPLAVNGLLRYYLEMLMETQNTPSSRGRGREIHPWRALSVPNIPPWITTGPACRWPKSSLPQP